jgi:hypothetical protein
MLHDKVSNCSPGLKERPRKMYVSAQSTVQQLRTSGVCIKHTPMDFGHFPFRNATIIHRCVSLG